MRDLFIFSALLILLVGAIRRPQVGLLTWLWISIMNPHRLTYGWAFSFPLLDIVVAVTVISCLMHWQERDRVTFILPARLLFIFYAWTCLTTVFAVDFALSLTDWIDFSKTILMVTFMLLFLAKKHWILSAMAVFVLSIGFYGVKGGLFTVLTGGGHRVWGPEAAAWGDNNGVSVAVLMALPICIAFFSLFTAKLPRLMLAGASICLFFSILGTQSRGALVGLIGMGLVMILRAKNKSHILVFAILALVATVAFMPDSWKDRMASIETYQEDESASTRITQWVYAIDIANERPLFGNGFDAFFHQPYYLKYVADKDTNRAVHSNYFQVLGEQGYIGLFMYLVMMASAVLLAGKWAKEAAKQKETKWAAKFLEMSQFSIAGYAFNGLTVNMAYLDLYYYILVFISLLIGYSAATRNNTAATSSQPRNTRLYNKARAYPALQYAQSIHPHSTDKTKTRSIPGRKPR